MAAHQAAWDDLAANALDPNPFYESWCLLPALVHLADRNTALILVWEDQNRQKLEALVPVQISRSWRGLPLPRLSLWRHPYCFLCTPLIRADQADNIVQDIRNFLISSSSIPEFIALSWVPTESGFLSLMLDHHDNLFRTTGEIRISQRALARVEKDYDSHFLGQIRAKKRKDLGRNRRRLAEQGELVTRFLSQQASTDELETAITDFTELEADSWKGEGGTAINSIPAHEAYFRQIMIDGAARGQGIVSTTRLDGRLIGGLLTLVSADHQIAYTVKIASSGDYQQFSIGSLVMLDIVRHAYDSGTIKALDSCATEDHPMINRLWTDRKRMSSLHLMPVNDWRQAIVPATDWALKIIRRQREPKNDLLS